jgi:hypothetical protein
VDITISMTGTAPLLQHNIRLADPLDPWTKALKSLNAKRSKTEDDHAEVQRIEWYGGIYFDDEIGVYVPTTWLEGSLIKGGSLYGRKGTLVQRALLFKDERVALMIPGPRKNLDALWEDGSYRDTRAVGVQRAKVSRTRPIFRQWSVEAEAYLDTNELDLDVLEQIADKAGLQVGIGDYRPRYGRFDAVIKQV